MKKVNAHGRKPAEVPREWAMSEDVVGVAASNSSMHDENQEVAPTTVQAEQKNTAA